MQVRASEIRILDDATIAQIAAGEVIERPVSVVKELVENSLDAGARHIAVELSDGGRTSVIVADDGGGISRDDLKTAFARHATSKLKSGEDLFAIRTLGFRGEGLASIASAGAVEIISRTTDSEVGSRVEARGTWIGDPTVAAAPVGTKVSVRELFSLTPARRAFLKSGRAEFARIASFLTQVALGWPNVGFSLRHDGRDVWSLPAVSDPVDRLETVFGRDARGALVKIDEGGDASRERVRGYVSAPGRDRPNRNAQVFFVNGRIVRSAALGAAWLAGYASFGMTGRYPFGVIALQLPSEDVDVNVHPTKIEVRFAFPEAVFEAVRRAVARTLRATQPARELTVTGTTVSTLVLEAMRARPEVGGEEQALQAGFLSDPSADEVRVLGQVNRSFIVAASEGELIVIDQHAAHERIAYEAIVDGAGKQGGSAPMLFPSVVELTPAQISTFYEFEPDLAAAGVVVEAFGDGAYRICALPSGYEGRRFDLTSLLDDLRAEDAPREGVAHRNRVLATVACHSVVRAGEALSLQEQSALFVRLLRCRDPHTCPHGRPTTLRLDAGALAKAFKRA